MGATRTYLDINTFYTLNTCNDGNHDTLLWKQSGNGQSESLVANLDLTSNVTKLSTTLYKRQCNTFTPIHGVHDNRQSSTIRDESSISVIGVNKKGVDISGYCCFSTMKLELGYTIGSSFSTCWS
jgi:hypothetical protein